MFEEKGSLHFIGQKKFSMLNVFCLNVKFIDVQKQRYVPDDCFNVVYFSDAALKCFNTDITLKLQHVQINVLLQHSHA